MTDIAKEIDNEVQSNDVVLFMKGNKHFPQCGFSNRACQVLRAAGVRYAFDEDFPAPA